MKIKPADNNTTNSLLSTYPQAQLTGADRRFENKGFRKSLCVSLEDPRASARQTYLGLTVDSEHPNGIGFQVGVGHYTQLNPDGQPLTYRGAIYRENLIYFILHQPIRIAPHNIRR